MFDNEPATTDANEEQQRDEALRHPHHPKINLKSIFENVVPIETASSSSSHHPHHVVITISQRRSLPLSGTPALLLSDYDNFATKACGQLIM